MKKGLIRLAAIASLLIVPLTSSAIPVRYDLGNHSIGGWSGSAWHLADRCRDGHLYKCGSRSGALTGYLLGDWNGTSLNITGGSLNGNSVNSGRLGGSYWWYLNVSNWGTFYFENMSINRITHNYLTLWGQNRQAYYYAKCKKKGYKYCKKGKGLDIYATPTKVPEPGSLALLGAGLLGIAFARRRRSA